MRQNDLIQDPKIRPIVPYMWRVRNLANDSALNMRVSYELH